MHRFFVSAEQVNGDTVTFSTDQAHQLRHVLRLRGGDCIRVFDGLTRVDRVVQLISADAGHVVGERAQAGEPRTRVVVYPALLRRDKFELVLQKLTELGAAAIVPVLTARSLVRKPPDDHRQTRWRAILREAAEQSGRGVVPELTPALAFPKAVQHAVSDGQALMAYEGEKESGLRDALAGLADATCVSLFVGPEGGYTPDEAQLADAAGVRLVTLGPRVLRTETAALVLTALMVYELESR
jgi:16S rRNA (uracil1498-N3)-methyltransferase